MDAVSQSRRGLVPVIDLAIGFGEFSCHGGLGVILGLRIERARLQLRQHLENQFRPEFRKPVMQLHRLQWIDVGDVGGIDITGIHFLRQCNDTVASLLVAINHCPIDRCCAAVVGES